jgi:hypothetical protein
MVGPGWEPVIGDEVIGVDDAQTSPLQQLALMLGLYKHIFTKDGVDSFGGIDILVMRISILFVITVVITITPWSIVNGVDVLKEAAVFHGLIGLGMDLVGTLQSFVVILLIVAATSRFLNHVDLMVVFIGTLASVIPVIIRPPVTIISAVAIVVVASVMTVAVAVLTMVIRFLIPAWWVFGA